MNKKFVVVYDVKFPIPTKKQWKTLFKLIKEMQRLDLMMKSVPDKVWEGIKDIRIESKGGDLR